MPLRRQAFVQQAFWHGAAAVFPGILGGSGFAAGGLRPRGFRPGRPDADGGGVFRPAFRRPAGAAGGGVGLCGGSGRGALYHK